MAGHTPGPWRASKSPKDGWFIVDRDDHLAHNLLYGLPDAELEANARLMAAAPELLALCREALAAVEALDEEYPSDDRLAARIAAAIAKAEGR
jgi:hypothetical protein